MPGLRKPQGVMPAGQLEPIEPVYTAANRQSVLGTQYRIPSAPTEQNAPVVSRREVTSGMRYVYSNARKRQPISDLGTGEDIGIAVWSSRFQPVQGKLTDWGFYDLLYRAGYPGFNLGLSFKVPVNPSVGSQGPGYNMHMKSPNKRVTVNVFNRISAAASMSG